MEQQRDIASKGKGDKQDGTPSKAASDTTKETKQPADGADGVSKPKYDEAIEKAVKDVHG